MGVVGGNTWLQLLAELMDSSPLEDECKQKSYHRDRVMGLKPGRKSDRELPPNMDYKGMSECEKKDSEKVCKKVVKKEYDCARKLSRSVAPMIADIVHVSNISVKLQSINHVRDHPLEEEHTFLPDKIALQLCIVEEVNLFGVRITFKRSNNCQVLA